MSESTSAIAAAASAQSKRFRFEKSTQPEATLCLDLTAMQAVDMHQTGASTFVVSVYLAGGGVLTREFSDLGDAKAALSRLAQAKLDFTNGPGPKRGGRRVKRPAGAEGSPVSAPAQADEQVAADEAHADEEQAEDTGADEEDHAESVAEAGAEAGTETVAPARTKRARVEAAVVAPAAA